MTQVEIRKWLGENHDHKLDVKFHCHGIRVTLYHSYIEICSIIADTIEDAFEIAVKNYETLLCAKLNQQLLEEEKRAKERLEEAQRNIDYIKRKIDVSIKNLSLE
jgi:hypothetical protein